VAAIAGIGDAAIERVADARAVLPFLAMMTIQEVVFVLLFAVVLMAAAELMVWGLDVVFWAPSKADECLSRERAS
jgi:hypothetical protein